MSYLQSHADPAARAKAVIVVGGVHAALGAALVIGLTYTKVFDPPKRAPIIDFPIDEPVPPTDPIDPVEPVETYLPPVAPIPPLDLTQRQPIDTIPPDQAPIDRPVEYVPQPLPTPTYAPVQPTPTPSFAPSFVRPSNRQAGWITNDDYSAADIRRGHEGTAAYRLIIGSDGRVDACEITASTGHASLDTATCRLITRRARFVAARDNQGRAVVGTFTGQVTWQIPE